MGAYLWAGVDSGWLGSRIQKKCFCTKYPAGRPNPSREGTQSGSVIFSRSGVVVAGIQVVEHGYSETQKTIGECQIVSEENAQTIHAHDSGRRRVWMRPRTYRRTSPTGG